MPGKYNLEELDALAKIMEEEKITLSSGAPAFYLALLEYFRRTNKKVDMNGARLFMGGSEPPLDMIKGFSELVNAEVVHAYGATETSQ